MRVCVLGLWHLGTVISACLASVGQEVVGIDFDEMTIQRLRAGTPPLYEPGLEDLVKAGLAQGNLSFTSDARTALPGADVVWVAYDTPINNADEADVDHVVGPVMGVLPMLDSQTIVLLSSQVPVGTTRRLERVYAETIREVDEATSPPHFAYSPENLRLGKAISTFLNPDRVVVGYRETSDRAVLERLLQPITTRIEWMSIESAEMTKHALNAFLATSVAFINEISAICEIIGADAREVERGLRSDPRIGRNAYLSPGSAYAGGTLARDIAFLQAIAREHGIPTPLFAGVKASNEWHTGWVGRRLEQLVGDLRGQTIAVWGLAYKPGTDTLRRSSSIELCRWLVEEGATLRVHDPAISHLPGDLEATVQVAATAMGAADGARVLIVATPWPDYQLLDAASVSASMAKDPIVLDPNRFLHASFRESSRLRYVSVGNPVRRPSLEEDTR